MGWRKALNLEIASLNLIVQTKDARNGLSSVGGQAPEFVGE